MNILEFKRKARGHTFRGGYDNEGTGLDFGAPGPSGNTDASTAGFGSAPQATSGGGFSFNPSGLISGLAGFFTGNPVAGVTGLARGFTYSGGTPTGVTDPTAPGASFGGGNMFSGGPGDSLSSIFSIASGINAMGNQSSGAQSLADPFSPYRANLAAQYAGALQPGTQIDITKMPGYSQYQSGVMDPAMEAVKRSMAVRGMNQSGNELLALQETGQKGYYGFMTDYLNRLAQGSGAVNNPAQAAGMGIDQQNLNQRATMQGLGAIGQGLSGLSGYFTGGGSGGGYSAAGYDVGGSGALNTSAYGSGLPAWQLAQADIYG